MNVHVCVWGGGGALTFRHFDDVLITEKELGLYRIPKKHYKKWIVVSTLLEIHTSLYM